MQTRVEGRSALRRTLRLVGALTSVNLRARMQYRFDFAVLLVFGIVFQAAALSFVWVVVAHFGGIRGWTTHQVLFVASLRLMAHGLNELVFGNLNSVTWMIRDGWFDRILVRPANALLQVVLVQLRANGVGDFLFAIVVFLVAQRGLGVHWTPLAVAYLVLVVVGSVLLEAGIVLVVASAAFWFVRVDVFAWWLDETTNTFANYPLNVYPVAMRAILTFALPIAFLAFYPATVFLGRTDEVPFTPLFAYGAPVVGALVFAAAYALWTVGVRHHRGTGT
jgi:ABC-2 type transport system permease protein